MKRAVKARINELMAEWDTMRFGLSERDAAEAWAESMALHEDQCPALASSIKLNTTGPPQWQTCPNCGHAEGLHYGPCSFLVNLPTSATCGCERRAIWMDPIPPPPGVATRKASSHAD